MQSPQNAYVAIMAGGIGSRFWPGSRVDRPKQFLDVLGVGKSLLRLTFERFLQLLPKERILVVTNEDYRALVKEHLPELEDTQIIGEPSRNNTAPCIAYTAFKLQALDPNASFIVAPSDHIILKEQVFLDKLRQGLDFVNTHDALLTLGITPTHPNTGYGYINFEENNEAALFRVNKFTEKPDEGTAKRFLESGNYLWNAGIFVWNVKNIIKAFKHYAPVIYDKFDAGRALYNTEKERAFIDEVYPTCPKISIDYAIMEQATNIYTLPADIGWSDLGTWASLHLQLERDEQNNAINSPLVMPLDSNNCLIRTQKDKLVVLKDLHNYIVIDEEDVLLIFPKDKEQEIKQVTGLLAKRQLDQFL